VLLRVLQELGDNKFKRGAQFLPHFLRSRAFAGSIALTQTPRSPPAIHTTYTSGRYSENSRSLRTSVQRPLAFASAGP
jgi:hypothetical protein